MLKLTVIEAPPGISGHTLDFRDDADRVVLRVEVWEDQGEVKYDIERFPR